MSKTKLPRLPGAATSWGGGKGRLELGEFCTFFWVLFLFSYVLFHFHEFCPFFLSFAPFFLSFVPFFMSFAPFSLSVVPFSWDMLYFGRIWFFFISKDLKLVSVLITRNQKTSKILCDNQGSGSGSGFQNITGYGSGLIIKI